MAAGAEGTGLAPEQIGVKYIPTSSLKPNPHNPRILFDKQPLETLKTSISNVGILVPLTVFWGKAESAFVILDGQRRWLCASALGIEKVPVNQVAEPTLVQNIVTMFQIHKLRADWELMPTALKLEVLMHELKERGDKQLADLTGLDHAVVVRCKKLLSFDRSYQDLMLAPEPDNRVKADFFIELHAVVTDRHVTKMSWFKKNVFTDRMLEKYQKRKGLKAVTDFRVMKQHIRNAVKARKMAAISRSLEEFTNEDDLPLFHLEIPAASVGAKVRKLKKDVADLHATIRDLDVDSYYGEEELWQQLEQLMKMIRTKLNEAGRRPN